MSRTFNPNQTRFGSGPVRPTRADEPYQIGEGVLLDQGEALARTSKIDREAREVEAHGAPELRTGPDPKGYVRPDCSVSTRKVN